ncbi:hypothetical protein K9M41_04275 [Candidatus Gracilibacteria bacterium]|nr:hypothetical protein [Candidatus Gracilibacteria bacterium]
MDKFSEAHDWLVKLSSESKFFRDKTIPKLEIVNRFLDELGRPDQSFDFRVIVGGTAGKGTVCRLIEDVLVRQGRKVLTLISPHVQVVTERIRLNGQLISREDFGDNILQIKEVAERVKILPTYYEAIVLAGILAGKKNNCEILVAEVGCGGEFDAVNAVKGSRISALTFIGEDHLEVLGGTLEKVAETKSGIFTADSVLNLSCEKKFTSILEKRGKVHFVKGIPNKLNKKLARNILEKILGTGDFAMQKVNIPARWEKIGNVILDGAHSAPRFDYILPKLQKIKGKKIGLLAMGKGHDPHSFKIIASELDEIVWTKVSGDREFWSPEELQKVVGRGEIEEDPIKAFNLAKEKEGTLLVLGSFYLAGQIRDLFYPSEKII